MLADYSCDSSDDYSRALVEILQEAVLHGLSEAGFFERAAFFGATALRLLHGMDRRSGELDFVLLEPDPSFSIMEYAGTLEKHVTSLGFHAGFRKASRGGAVLQGAWRRLLTALGAPEEVRTGFHPRKLMRIGLNVETSPVAGFETEQRFLQRPVLFPVRSVSLPDALAWKIHRLLSPPTGGPAAGADWLDFSWFVSTSPEVGLAGLESLLRAEGAYTEEAPLTLDHVQFRLVDRIKALSFRKARLEALALIGNPAGLDHWSREYFGELVADLESV